MKLQDKLKEMIPTWREEKKEVLSTYGKKKIADVTVAQAFGGMRGIKGMICDTSVVEPNKGLIIRGHPLLTIKELWPEEVFYLLLTGEKPDKKPQPPFRKTWQTEVKFLVTYGMF